MEAIYIFNENEGYTGGGSGFVYITLDGGENWNFHGTLSSSLTDMDFASASQGYACGNSGAVYNITGSHTYPIPVYNTTLLVDIPLITK